MATYIKTIEDANGDIIAPRTRIEAVVLEDGSTNLQEVIDTVNSDITAVEGSVSTLETTVATKASTGKAIAMSIVFG